MQEPHANPPVASEKIAFRMFLRPGCAAEYQARHDALWPELAALLRSAGISDYSIFVDPTCHELFAVLRRRPDHTMDALPREQLMQRWWAYMADLMRTHADSSPVTEPLSCMFHLD
jgi:L-rhamnose mutarotase